MKDFFDHLEGLFRYFFSGIITMFFIAYFYPLSKLVVFFKSLGTEWLQHIFNWYGITLISLIIGVAIYTINRYVVVVLLDYLYFIFSLSSFAPSETTWKKRINPFFYMDRLSEHLEKRFDTKIFSPEFSKHLLIRRAHFHLLYFLFEISFFIVWLMGKKIHWVFPIIIFCFLIFQELTMEKMAHREREWVNMSHQTYIT